ncbi:MAG: 3-hydroxyacyl-CoA dehydrogenase family protein [Acidimicrobiia bacterium]|nr:3-hydroxyacyl-CoA dehydrogenase family protein [Acidimicrobiia bacterium]
MTGAAQHRIERVIERVVVLGDGPAVPGIAQVLAVAGYRVVLCGDSESLAAARAELDGGRFGLLAAADAGRISRDERTAALERLRFAEAPNELAPEADLAVVSCAATAATELAARLAELERRLPAEATLAVDSPGDSLAALSSGLARPERLVGWHWGQPAQLNKLAEIVAGAATAGTAVEIVVQVARRAGKNPVVTRDAPDGRGFVTNRLWAALRGEAERIVAAGVAQPEQVDQLAADCFGWPAGPFSRGGEAR